MPPSISQSIAASWFKASESMGNFMGIRYGRVTQGNDSAEWTFVSHCECDGIGGFARLLRQHGAELGTLPETKNSCREVIRPLWNLLLEKRKSDTLADRRDWAPARSHHQGTSSAVAWHRFSEQETTHIREECRRNQVTVNSFLLKHLDHAVRQDIKRPHLKIPWMIPVNLRGDIHLDDDTENHVSCIDVKLAPNDTAMMIQSQIRDALKRGEHRANYLILSLGKFLSHNIKLKCLIKDQTQHPGNIGAFSNLGVWDSAKNIKTTDSWLFCPPVVNGQLLGAGCVTFQNRLSLTLQAHPSLSKTPEIANNWISRWVDAISQKPEFPSDKPCPPL